MTNKESFTYYVGSLEERYNALNRSTVNSLERLTLYRRSPLRLNISLFASKVKVKEKKFKLKFCNFLNKNLITLDTISLEKELLNRTII